MELKVSRGDGSSKLVTANILYGNIEILDGTPVGELVVVLSGEKEALASAQDAIRQAGVQLKVLKGGQ